MVPFLLFDLKCIKAETKQPHRFPPGLHPQRKNRLGVFAGFFRRNVIEIKLDTCTHRTGMTFKAI